MAGSHVLADILCGVDGTRASYEAVSQAASLLATDGRLTLLVATEQRGSEPWETATVAPALAQRSLDRAQRLAHEAGVTRIEQVAATGPAEEVLLAGAREHSLLAMGAPNVSRLAHMFVGGISSEIVHALPCSLLVARRPPADVRFGERIMVASDGSDRSDALLSFAIGLAAGREAGLVLFHAPHAESSAQPTRIAAQTRRVREALDDLAVVCVEPGRPQTTIAEAAAREGASLLLVASRARSGLRALGSVSERLVHSAPCSVLVLRPEDLSR